MNNEQCRGGTSKANGLQSAVNGLQSTGNGRQSTVYSPPGRINLFASFALFAVKK